MSRNTTTGLLGLLATLAFALCSCTAEDSAPTSRADSQETEDKATPSATAFESDRHLYRLEVPTGWTVAEYEGTWKDFKQFSPGGEVPGEDVVSAPGVQAFLVANSMAIPTGTSAADWVAELQRLVGSGRDRGCRESNGTAIVAGEPATIVVHRCEDMTLVGRSLTHGSRGYYFTIGYPAGDAGTAATLDGVVSSIRFVDP